ncbi:MAG: hypothetical protein J3Q66DRAFT_393293 [Benniella sp.]|nr:MAG: hypothetical protein J3Q66DRAFT_393293 [Benniella sp.]
MASEVSTALVGSLISVTDVLDRPLPDLDYFIKPGSSSTTDSPYSRVPAAVLPWDEFTGEAESFSYSTERTLHPDRFPFLDDIVISDESSTGIALTCNVYAIINRIRSTEQIGMSSEVESVVGQPDRVVFGKDRRDLKMIIEIKTKTCLSSDDLSIKYNEDIALLEDNLAPRNPVWRQVQQVYGYMCLNSLRYGILSTYEQSWFLRRHDDILSISRAVHKADLHPSVLKSHMYIMDLIKEEHTSPCPVHSIYPGGQAGDSGSISGRSQHAPSNTPQGQNQRGGSSGRSIHGPSNNPQRQYQRGSTPIYMYNKHRGTSKISHPFKRIAPKPAVYNWLFSFSDFSIQDVLGQGRSGKVYRARWGDEDIAVKICDLNKNPSCEDDLRNELDTYHVLRHLQGTYVPRLKFSGYDSGLFALGMEIAGRPLDPSKLTHTDRSTILDGLYHIHRYGVIHNDLRCANILVSQDEGALQVKFVDFADSKRTFDVREQEREMFKLTELLRESY